MPNRLHHSFNVDYCALLGIGNTAEVFSLYLLRKNLMLSDVEKGNNLMLRRLTPVVTTREKLAVISSSRHIRAWRKKRQTKNCKYAI